MSKQIATAPTQDNNKNHHRRILTFLKWPKKRRSTDPTVEQAGDGGTPNVQMPQTPGKQHSFVKYFALFAGLVLMAVIGVIVNTRIVHKQPNPDAIPAKNIVIGRTVITPQEIKDLSVQMASYSKSARANFGGPSVQAAENELILNAALKDQATKHNVVMPQADSGPVLSQAGSAGSGKSTSNSWPLMNRVLNENQAYETKLESIVIAKKNLFVVGITYDSPYFNNSSNPAALRSKAFKLLQSKFLPLFQKGESEAQIAAQTELNYTGSHHPLNNPQIFFTGMHTFAYDYYDCTAATPCFNDAQVGSFASIPGIVSTQTEINQLTKVGQNTNVFISKAGFIGVMRLTGQTPGAYSSWNDLTQSYKKKYAPQLAPAVNLPDDNYFSSLMLRGLHGVMGLVRDVGSLILPAKAYAAVVCSQHDVTIYYNAFFYNTQTGVTTPASGAWLQESRGASDCPTSGGYYVDDSGQPGHRPNRMTTGSDGTASAADNCYTPVPYLEQRGPPVPSGFTPGTPSDSTDYLRSAKVSSGGNSYKVYNATDFGNQFGPTAENNTGSDIYKLWSGGIINNNGGMTVNITYNITPQPPVQNPPQPSDSTLRCSALSYGGGTVTVGTQTYRLYGGIDLSGATIDAANITSHGNSNDDWYVNSGTNTAVDGSGGTPDSNPEVTRPASDFVSSTGHGSLVRSMNATLIPNAQYVSVTINEYYYDGSNWDLYDTITATTVQCYRAGCFVQSVTGDLPGGYIRNGGPVTITASVPNDSNDPVWGGVYTNMAIPQTDGAGNSLVIHTNQGDSSPFSVASNSTQTITFTITAPSSGAIGSFSGGVEYNNGDFWLSGSGDCSYTYSIYQPPLVNIDNAICGSSSPTLNGWAFAQNGEQGVSIYVTAYADGPQGSGTLIGTFLANLSRPDVDAAYGIPGNHGFSIAIPTSYQDGQNHSFYVYANPDGVESSVATYTMTGCESFSLTPGASSAKLSPNFEAPTSFDGTTAVSLTYGPNGNSTFGPAGWTGSFPGVDVGTSGSPYYVSYAFTKNGGQIQSGSVPSDDSAGYFKDNQTWSPTAYAIAPGTYDNGDNYCINVSANPIAGYVQNDGTILSATTNGPDTQTSCDTVHNEPYAQFFGNDVVAGGGFGNNGCTNQSGIYTYSYDGSTSPVTGQGSGTQFGAQALGIIEGFDSSLLRTLSPARSTGLTFANTSFPSGYNTDNNTPGANMGGEFGLSSYCVPDYYGAKPNSLSSQDTSSSSSVNSSLVQVGSTANDWGQWYKPGGGTLTLGGGTIGVGTNEAIYVEGNVYITGNITYAGSNSWANIGDIPSFYLVVKGGNIYISKNVTQLDGVYVAEPAGSGTGIINTCANSSGSIAVAGLLPSGFSNNCGRQLTVNGAFAAQQVFLDRSYSSLRYSNSGDYPGDGLSNNCGTPGKDIAWPWAGAPTSGPDCAAEIFNFSPELYLTQPVLTPSSGPGTGKFDYITSLSPTL